MAGNTTPSADSISYLVISFCKSLSLSSTFIRALVSVQHFLTRFRAITSNFHKEKNVCQLYYYLWILHWFKFQAKEFQSYLSANIKLKFLFSDILKYNSISFILKFLLKSRTREISFFLSSNLNARNSTVFLNYQNPLWILLKIV